MDYDAMIGRVADVTGLERSQAERATRAFFETLAARLGNDESRELASQLPMEFQDCLAPTQPDVEKLSPDEFLYRLATAAGLDQARAEQVTHAVWGALQAAVPVEDLGDVRSQLPNELTDIFDGIRTTRTGRQVQ